MSINYTKPPIPPHFYFDSLGSHPRMHHIDTVKALKIAEIYGMGALRRAMMRDLMGYHPLQLRTSVVEIHRTIHGNTDNIHKIVGEIPFAFPPHFCLPDHKPTLLKWVAPKPSEGRQVIGGARPGKNSHFLMSALYQRGLNYEDLEKRATALSTKFDRRIGDRGLYDAMDLVLSDEKHIYPGTVTGRISMKHSNFECPAWGSDLPTQEEVIHPKP